MTEVGTEKAYIICYRLAEASKNNNL